MIPIIALAGAMATGFVVLLVLVAIGSHLEDRRSSIRKRPVGRLITVTRRVTGLYVRPGAAHRIQEPANDKKEVRI